MLIIKFPFFVSVNGQIRRIVRERRVNGQSLWLDDRGDMFPKADCQYDEDIPQIAWERYEADLQAETARDLRDTQQDALGQLF